MTIQILAVGASMFTLYMGMAVIGTAAFLILMGLMLVGVGAGAGDFDIPDVEVEAPDFDADMTAHDAAGFAAFKLLTVQSVLAFIMGFGWMGLALHWGASDWPEWINLVGAMGFGVVAMVFSAWMMAQVRKLQHESRYSVKTTLGSPGKTYTRVPAKGKGAGQVELNVEGRKQIVNAISVGPEIDAFTAVSVVHIEGKNTVVVEPTA